MFYRAHTLRITNPLTLRVLRLLVAGSLFVACDSQEPSTSEEGAHAEALVSDAREVDAPSKPAISLKWKSAPDGKARSRLEFEVENNTDTPIDVDLRVSSRAGQRSSDGRGKRVRLNGRGRMAQGFGVDELGLQLVGKSASAMVIATYEGADGLLRATPLSPVWVEHEPGFKTARVRGSREEASANAARGLSALRAQRPRAGRSLDAQGRVTELVGLDDRSWGAGVVAQLPDFPKPSDYQRPDVSAAELSAEERELSDAERPSRSPRSSAGGSFNKSGSYYVCLRTPYFYMDSLLGDDYLNAQTTTDPYLGWESSRYMFALLADSAGNFFWAGYLDSSGCTPFLGHGDGNYTAYVTASLYNPSTDVAIDVFNDTSRARWWAYANYSISGPSGSVTIDGLGWESLEQVNAAVAAGNAMFRSGAAFANGTYTEIFLQQTCPDPKYQGSACMSQGDVYLGTTQSGDHHALSKVVLHHELGHRAQESLIGKLTNDYTITATEDACRCDHVKSSNKSHCLQSRHLPSTAQVEGWAQFFAATNLNIGSQNNCVLAYYKEFRETNGGTTYPPMAKSCYAQVRWRNNYCSASSQGTEYDWMNFYWRLRHKDGYTFNSFKSVYWYTCGQRRCDSMNPAWSLFTAGANAAFGAGSAMATAWATQAANFGVNF